MKFFKQNWFKILILLPFIPVGMLIYSLEGFTGIDESLRLLVGIVLVAASLFLFFLGFYFELSKGDIRRKKVRFKIGNYKFGVAEIGRVILSLSIVGFFYATFSFASISLRVNDVLDNVTTQPDVPERSYSLVVRADFDVNNQGSYGRVGILDAAEEEKVLAVEAFLDEQNFLVNPVQEFFNSPLDLIDALYEEKVDAIIIGSNFVQVFNDLERFKEIENETIALSQFEVEIESVERDTMDPGEPFSVLIMGLDAREDGNLSEGRIDTFMLLTVDLENLSFTLVSIPRDSLVQIPLWNYQVDKLAHTGGNIAAAVGTIEHMFDMEIPYYVLVNFNGVLDIINVLGGITVDVPVSFTEQDSRRRADRIHLEKGVQRLNGEQALALARHRNTLSDHDFARAGHGQLVIQALIAEMLSNMTGIHDALPMFETLGHNIQTNFSRHDLTLLAQYMLEYLPQIRHTNLMEELHFINMVVRGDTPQMQVGNHGQLAVVLLWSSWLEEARRLMMINLGVEEPEFTFTFEFDGFTRSRQLRPWELRPDYYSGTLPGGNSAPPQPEGTPSLPGYPPQPPAYTPQPPGGDIQQPPGGTPPPVGTPPPGDTPQPPGGDGQPPEEGTLPDDEEIYIPQPPEEDSGDDLTVDGDVEEAGSTVD